MFPITRQSLDTVLGIELAAYAFPWSRANFIDSLAANHDCGMLCDARGGVLGYFVAMAGVDEMHLLNLTVAPGAQGHGHGRSLLGAVVQLCESRAARVLWLEVRQSNLRALRIYERFGFEARAVRKRYYPAALGGREDAVVMSLNIAAASEHSPQSGALRRTPVEPSRGPFVAQGVEPASGGRASPRAGACDALE
ncbi:MAG: ribosomal protein S18-alanine N-acetyltransferase [Burkholderiaceae bacterium]